MSTMRTLLRLSLLVAIGAMTLASLVACGSSEERASSSTLEPTASVAASPPASLAPLGVRVLGPLETDGSLFDEPGQSSYFVVEVDNGQIYAIQSASPNEWVVGVHWVDNDSLLVNTQMAAYEVFLDGRVLPVPSTPTPVPTPRACVCTSLGCSVCEGPVASADGAWSAYKEPKGWGTTVIGLTSGDAAFRLTNADQPAWAPQGHLLAFNGNVCVGLQSVHAFDIFLFNPVSRQLTNLTTSVEGAALNFLWRPDGTAIAVDERSLELIDVPGGEHRELAKVNATGELQPVEWSPDGKSLIFFHLGGRGICDGADDPRVIAPAPTTLEVIGQ